MDGVKFVDLTTAQQIEYVRAKFEFREGEGWFTTEGRYAGQNEAEVTAALIELEAAEIAAIGDCMTGCCMVPPRLEDFVKKP